MKVAAKALRAAAASVTGARSMGIETAASKAAPGLLASAHAWLRAEIAGAQFERRWQEVSEAAAVLAAALGVPSFDDEEAVHCQTVARRDRAAEAAEIERQRSAQEWADARETTVAARGNLVDGRGVPVAVVTRSVYTEPGYGHGAVYHGFELARQTISVVAKDGRTLPCQEWVSSPKGEFVVTMNGLTGAGVHGTPETSATSQWLPTVPAERRSEMRIEMDLSEAFSSRASEKKARAERAQKTESQVGAMAAAFAALRRS